ncbi:hypothetical protein [Streptomyces benahoarensis]|uniref:Lipoprotein n=1 Tax=Streptomyces benahoarensis TaxID=2595054 RepID=A0A553YPW2_9ACTN|nr:hypothetical protein [Streptomyces benahoarensis]TSB19492.1 hypothetical protein FNJ62_22370 [Streptomyces benahoarensis]TSB31229.1 hypothetical protein FNZ23_25980 [Streptomyces benahoarensis]
MRWRNAFVAAVGLLTVSSGVSGCSIVPGAPDLTVTQAVRKIDSSLNGVFGAIHPRVKWREGPGGMDVHDNSFTNKPNGVVSVHRERYLRTKVSGRKLDKITEVVRDYLKKSGFELEEKFIRPHFVSAKSPDGLEVGFLVEGSGGISIGASVDAKSPGHGGDIEGEEGDKFPTAPDGGPDHAPDLYDPYWSK